jgi:hypothetical protein
MPIVLFEKDPFTELEANLLEGGTIAQNVNVRRPLYGMLPKWAGDGQAKFAYIAILVDSSSDGVGGDLRPISLINSSAPTGFANENHNFILQTVAEARQEKVQVIETFGDHFTFFYGQKPIVLRCSGMLFNTHDFNWKNEWLNNYNEFLRGTRCVENKARVFLGFDDVVAEGYMLNTSVVYDKDMPNVCPLSFQLLLTKPPIDLSAGYDKVTKATQARSLDSTAAITNGQVSELFIEYLSELHDPGKFVVDDATGQIVKELPANANVPATVESLRSAAHITGADPPWSGVKKNPLTAIDAGLYAGQLGVDKTTAVLAVTRNAESTQLGSRSSAVVASAASLERGVSNTAVVVPDAEPV